MLNTEQDFMTRHGECVRDPNNPRVWLFEDGATLTEESHRGQAQASEPSADPIARLEIQIRYLHTVYANACREFNDFERDCDIERMKSHGELLKSLNAKLEAKQDEFQNLPEVKEARRKQEDEHYRRTFVEGLKRDQQHQLREEARAVASGIRSSVHIPHAYHDGMPLSEMERSQDPTMRRIESLNSVRELAEAVAEMSYARMNRGR